MKLLKEKKKKNTVEFEMRMRSPRKLGSIIRRVINYI